ncbi:MAG: FIVAR domain-containing protein, partial [Clostridia bacterium]|nr:FIVAR domain-containing protein [Clostridia bacterium]
MKKTNFKKALSVFLSVLMIMSCWVWVAPTEAEAATTEVGVTTSFTLSPQGNRGTADWTRLALTGESSEGGTSVVLFRFTNSDLNTLANNPKVELQFYAYSCTDRLTHKGGTPVNADVYYITSNGSFVSNQGTSKSANVTDTGNILGTNFSGSAPQNSAKNYFGLSDATKVGTFEQPAINGQGYETLRSGEANCKYDVTNIVKQKATAGEDLSFIVMLQTGYSCSGTVGWSDIYINSDTVKLAGITADYQISSINELKTEIEYFESCVENNGAFYTNMNNNYRAYNDAKRYYDAVVYGGVPFDASLASWYYSELHNQMYNHTGLNSTYVNYLNANITSRDGSAVSAAYRKNVIWYPWDFAWDITSNDARPEVQDTYFYFTMPNTIVGITSDSETTFPLHSFFWTTTGSRFVRYVIAGSGTLSSGVVGSSDFATMAPWKISNNDNRHGTSGLAPGSDEAFGGWVFEKNYRTDFYLDNAEDNSNNFSYNQDYVYQISSYAQINKSSVGVNASNVYKKVDQGFTFATSNSANNGTTRYGNHYASNYINYGGALHVVYMDTYKNNYENWKALFPALSYKNYNGYVYSDANNVTTYLDEASDLNLELSLQESNRVGSIDSTVTTWATNVNRGANSLAYAKSAGTTRVTNKYLDLINAIKAADSLYSAGNTKYTAASWNAFKTAYEAARSHMAALNPSGSNTQYSSDATTVGNLATALQNAKAALQYVTVTYKYYDGTVAKTISAANGEVLIGTTAADLSSQAPTNTSIESADDTNHYVYSWPTFSNVTDSAIYQETRGTQAHQLGDYIIDKAATCTTEGSKHKECANCDYVTAAETIPTIAHTEEVVTGKPASCTETGLTDGKICAVCGEILVAQEEIPMAAHTEEVIPAVPATCTTPGKTEGKKCSVCGTITVAQQDTELAAHTEATRNENVTNATCGQEGSYELVTYCSVCNAELGRKTVTVSKLPHTEEVIAAVPATCTTTGKTEGKKCSVCGEILVEPQDTPMADHNYSDWTVDGNNHTRTCTACSKTESEAHSFTTDCQPKADSTSMHDYKCSVCTARGALVGGNPVLGAGEECYANATCTPIEGNNSNHTVTCECSRTKEAAHNSVEVEGTYEAPNCLDKGSQGYKCNDCGYTYTKEIAALGHEYETEFTVDVAPKCETVGSKSRHCVRCDDKIEITEIPALQHDYELTDHKDATCEAPGYDTYTCKNDASHGYSDVIPATGHNYSAVITARPELVDGAWTDGTYTYTCSNDANHTYTEKAVRADYAEFDAAVAALEELKNNDKLTTDAENEINEALALAEALADNLVTSEQEIIDDCVAKLNKSINSVNAILASIGKPQPIVNANSGLKVQFFESVGAEALESLQLNAGGGFDAARIKLTNNNATLPITLTEVTADKANVESGAGEVIAINGSLDLAITAGTDFTESGLITYTIKYKVGSDETGYLKDADGNPIIFTTKAYLYVKAAAYQPYHFMDEKTGIGGVSKWDHYVEATNYGDFTLISENTATQFSDKLESGTKWYSFGTAHTSYDYDEDGCQAGCTTSEYKAGDGHAATYGYFVDTSLAPTWQAAGFRLRIVETEESTYQNAPLKTIRVANDQTYLDGIKGDDKTFTLTFYPSATGTQNKTWAITSTGTLDVATYANPDEDNELLFGEHKNKDGFDENTVLALMTGEIPSGVNEAKFMLSPRIEFNGTIRSESVTMTSHIYFTSYDKAALREAVANAETAGYNPGYFDDDKYAAYEEALANAKEVLGKAETTQADVDEAKANLTATVDNLTRAEYVLTVTHAIRENADKNSEATNKVNYYLLEKGLSFVVPYDAIKDDASKINKYDDAATLTINDTAEHTYNYWYIDYSKVQDAIDAADEIINDTTSGYSEEYKQKAEDAKKDLQDILDGEDATTTPESQSTVDDAIDAVTALTGHTCNEDV